MGSTGVDRIRELEAALRVFAAQAAGMSATMSDDRPLYAYGDAPKLTVGDFRRAALALGLEASK